jgi:hypothetical protein
VAEEVHANSEVGGKKDHDKHGKGKDKKDGKKGGTWQKYKWYIIVCGILVAVLIIYFVKKNGGSSSPSTAQTAADTDESQIDPATGYPYGSPADLAALGQGGNTSTTPTSGDSGGGSDGTNGTNGTVGATGATGKTGAKGATGKAGKTIDLWDIAKDILHNRGIKNPSHAQILGVWKSLGHIGEKSKVSHNTSGKKPPAHPVHGKK